MSLRQLHRGGESPGDSGSRQSASKSIHQTVNAGARLTRCTHDRRRWARFQSRQFHARLHGALRHIRTTCATALRSKADQPMHDTLQRVAACSCKMAWGCSIAQQCDLEFPANQATWHSGSPVTAATTPSSVDCWQQRAWLSFAINQISGQSVTTPCARPRHRPVWWSGTAKPLPARVPLAL